MTVSTLPEDVLGEIIETSSRDAQATLCQVSRLFNSLGIRYLYRSVILSSPRQVLSCCKTLTANPVAAEAVQTFSLQFPRVQIEPDRFFLSFYQAIYAAITSLPNLITLELDCLDAELYNVIANVTFPRLIDFTCVLLLDFSLPAFLNHHGLTLERLTFMPTPYWEPRDLYPNRPEIYLPRLKYFMGSISDFYAVIPGTNCLEHATILSFSRTSQIDTENLVATLHKHCVDSLRSLACSHREPWNLNLIEGLSEQLPNLESLDIHYGQSDGLLDKATLQAIALSLLRFKALKSLTINGKDVFDIRANDDSTFPPLYEWRAVSIWGLACPTLDSCVFLDTTWSRMRGNAWASVDNVNDWMEEMAEFSTIEELEEVLDAMTWMFQSQFGLGDGDMEAFIAPLRITLCLKQIMESYERAKSTGG